MHVSNFLSKLLKLSKSSSVIFISFISIACITGKITCYVESEKEVFLKQILDSSLYNKKNLEDKESRKESIEETLKEEFVGNEYKLGRRYENWRLPNGLIIQYGPMDD